MPRSWYSHSGSSPSLTYQSPSSGALRPTQGKSNCTNGTPLARSNPAMAQRPGVCEWNCPTA